MVPTEGEAFELSTEQYALSQICFGVATHQLKTKPVKHLSKHEWSKMKTNSFSLLKAFTAQTGAKHPGLAASEIAKAFTLTQALPKLSKYQVSVAFKYCQARFVDGTDDAKIRRLEAAFFD